MTSLHDAARTELDVFEIDGQQYTSGDRVRFERAGMRWNRARVYQITEATAYGLRITADGCNYTLSRADIASLGITRADRR